MQRVQVLRLYRGLLKEAVKVKDYNLKEYIRRRSGEQFREYEHLTDNKQKQELLNWAEQQLEVVRRQRIVQNLYFSQQNVLQQK